MSEEKKIDEQLLEEVRQEVSDIVTKVYCDVCSKCCTSDDGKTLLGQAWGLRTGDIDAEFNKKQTGEYKLNHNYYVCWECSLRALGVKP